MHRLACISDLAQFILACGSIRFSSLLAAGNVSRGGTSATRRQKFHTDDANQRVHNKSGSHGVSNINLSNFKVSSGRSVLVKCCVHLAKCPSEKLIKCFFLRRLYYTNIDCFVRDSLRLHLTFVAFCLLSVIHFVCQSALLTGFRPHFTSPVWNFCR